MKKNRLFKFVGIALIVVLAVSVPLISSCRPAPEAASPEAAPIKVGVVSALTGYMAADAIGYNQGIELAADEINAQGGLLGRPIELLYFDIGDFAPETLELAAKQLVGVDKVDMAIGGWAGWGQDIRAFGKYDIPSLFGDAADMSIKALQEPGNGNCFQFYDGEHAISLSTWKFLKELPYEWPNNKVALIGADDAWGRGMIEGIREYAEADGWEVPIFEIVPYGTMEWGPILTKMRAEKPAVLEVEVASPPDVIALFRQFMLDPTPTMLCWGYSMSQRGFMDTVGEEVNGLLGETGGYLPFPASTPELADWFERFEAKYGMPARNSGTMYEAFMMWAEAVRQVGDPTDYDAIVKWMEDNTYQAMPGMRVLDFNEERHVVVEEAHPNTFIQVQNGEWVMLYHDVYGDPYVDYQGNSYDLQVPPWIK